MDIKQLRKKQEKFYKSIVAIFCPILNETVYFTSEGFSHLIYDSNWRPRNINEQFMKLKCLSYVPVVVGRSNEVVKIRKIKIKIKGKIKSGIHIALVHEVSKGIEIRVIIQKIGIGKYKFLSVMHHNNKSRKNSKLKSTRRGAH